MSKLHKKSLLCLVLAWIVLALFAGILALLYRFDNKYTAGPPYGENGVFSFAEADLNRPLFLIDGCKLNNQEVFIGEYSNFSYLPGGTSPFGVGNYRLTLRFDGPPTTLVLEIPPIFTEYTLSVNGMLAAETGSGSAVAIPVGEGDTVLDLHTVNRAHYYSGLTYPPGLGTPQVMDQLFFGRTLCYAALCVTALTLALFSLVLWVSRARDALFRQFGVLCLAFSVHCLHPFVWRLAGYTTRWSAVEDASWMLVLSQAALAALCAGVEHAGWYRRGFRPVTLLFCLFCSLSVLFIIPNAANYVNFYGRLIDWYKLAIWRIWRSVRPWDWQGSADGPPFRPLCLWCAGRQSAGRRRGLQRL